MNIALTYRNSEILRKYSEVWNRIKDCFGKINNNKLREYDKDYMKIKFNSHYNILLNKQLNFPAITVIIWNILSSDFLDGCLHEV